MAWNFRPKRPNRVVFTAEQGVKPHTKCHLCTHARVHHDGYLKCTIRAGNYSCAVKCKCPGFVPKPKPSEWKTLLDATKRSQRLDP